jgi:hypothetical protein
MQRIAHSALQQGCCPARSSSRTSMEHAWIRDAMLTKQLLPMELEELVGPLLALLL